MPLIQLRRLVLPIAAVAIALSLAIKCWWHIGRLPWTDEVLTLELVNARSYRHMLDAVYRGIDATPPLYTTVGRILVKFTASPFADLVAMRLFNLALVLAALVCLFVMVRRIVGRDTAFLTLALFVFTLSPTLVFLILEIRTYALMFFVATLSLLLSVIYIFDGRRRTLFALSVAFAILMASHTLAVIYIAAIDLSLFVALSLRTSARQSLPVLAAALPAVVLLVLWLPVVRHERQLGNWIESPTWLTLFSALSLWNPIVLFGLPIVLLSLSVANRVKPSWLSGVELTTNDRRKTSVRFVFVAAASFVVVTLILWMFSRAVLPVFLKRYFYPDILIHVPWLCAASILMIRAVSTSEALTATLVLASALACIKIGLDPVRPAGIPCLAAKPERFIESDAGTGVFVTSSLHTWVPRLWNTQSKYIVVSDPLPAGPKSNILTYRENFLSNIKLWWSLDTIVSTQALLDTFKEFYVLDDRSDDWPARLAEEPGVTLKSVTQTSTCTLWHANVSL